MKAIYIITAALFSVAAQSIYAQSIEKDKIKSHITYLASDELKGRGTGTAEELKAAEYIAQQFAAVKLKPMGEKGGYLQSHQFSEPANPHATGTDTAGKKRNLVNVIGYLDNGAKHTIVIGAHYDHLGLGHDGN